MPRKTLGKVSCSSSISAYTFPKIALYGITIAKSAVNVLRPKICKKIKAQKSSWIALVIAKEIRTNKKLKNNAKKKPIIEEKNIANIAIEIVFKKASNKIE